MWIVLIPFFFFFFLEWMCSFLMCYSFLVIDIWEMKEEELNVWAIVSLLEMTGKENLKSGGQSLVNKRI